jgi:hypothetical protein
VEIVAFDEHARESQSRIPASDENAGVIWHGGRRSTLLYGLVAFDQIVLRRIYGHERFPAFLAKEWSQAA